MNELMFKAWAKAQCAKQQAKKKASALWKTFLEEDGGPEAIIIAVIMIIIVVALAVIFREQIGAWVNKLFNSANDEITSVTSGDAGVSVIE